jgi:hypothetical protein
MSARFSEKKTEMASLRNRISQLEKQTHVDDSVIEDRVRTEMSKRDKELRLAIVKCQEEVAAVMTRREQRILDAVKVREDEILEMWKEREERIRKDVLDEVKDREAWIEIQAEELSRKAEALDEIRKELEMKLRTMNEASEARKRLCRMDHMFYHSR